jgi:two-component system, chemotaxis family, response regulator Rcp1
MSKMIPIGAREILLVEDNPGDVSLVRKYFGSSKSPTRINHVESVALALEFLRKEGEYRNAPDPHLILLDLNLPGRDGRELLVDIKSDDDLKQIPVIVLTTSIMPEDITDAYNLHANCCLVKPIEYNQLVEILTALEYFWFTIATLPGK